LNDEPIIFETTSDIGSENDDNIIESNKNNLESNSTNPLSSNESQNEVQIDPNDFMTIKPHKLYSSFPDLITELDSDESVASDDEQRKLVSEAFADDDVINDFKKEKLEKIENEEEKNVSLHLPGWGTWAGDGIKPSKRKIRQFTIKAKKRLRKDTKLGNAIICEKKDESIAKFRVSFLINFSFNLNFNEEFDFNVY
jgi:U3 small nucleolar RNA-associated protein 14